VTWDSGLTRRDRAAPAQGELELICRGGSRADPVRCALQGMRSGWGATFLQRDVVVAASWLVRKLGCGQRLGWCRSWDLAAIWSVRQQRPAWIGIGEAARSASELRLRPTQIGVVEAAWSASEWRQCGDSGGAACYSGSRGLRGDWRREVRVRERLMGRVAG